MQRVQECALLFVWKLPAAAEEPADPNFGNWFNRGGQGSADIGLASMFSSQASAGIVIQQLLHPEHGVCHLAKRPAYIDLWLQLQPSPARCHGDVLEDLDFWRRFQSEPRRGRAATQAADTAPDGVSAIFRDESSVVTRGSADPGGASRCAVRAVLQLLQC